WAGLGLTVLAPNLGRAARILDRTMHAPEFAPESILAERSLLVEETTQVADDMYRFPFQLAFAAGFSDKGYGIPALGLPEQISQLSPESVREWHAVMTSRRGVIVAVGDLDPDAAMAQLSEVFGEYGDRAGRQRPSRISLAVGGERSVRRE